VTYAKQTWQDDNPAYPVSDDRMSHIEDGIYDAHYVPLLTAFPTSPIEGQLAYMQAHQEQGIVWMFRYRNTTGTYKWEYVGGPPLVAWVDTVQSLPAAGSWGDPTTPGPDIVIPFSGEYVALYSAAGRNLAGAADFSVGLAVGAAGTPATWVDESMHAIGYIGQAHDIRPFSPVSPIAAERSLAAGNTLRMRYRSTQTQTQVSNRKISLLPIRCG
jgi:hypothetical protein